jgi:hypothetical protein
MTTTGESIMTTTGESSMTTTGESSMHATGEPQIFVVDEDVSGSTTECKPAILALLVY